MTSSIQGQEKARADKAAKATTPTELDKLYQVLGQRVASFGPLSLPTANLMVAFITKLHFFLLSQGFYCSKYEPFTKYCVNRANYNQYITVRVREFMVQVVVEPTRIMTFDEFTYSPNFTHHSIQSLVDNLHGAEERYCIYLKERARVRIIGKYCNECHYSAERGKYCGLGIVLNVGPTSPGICYQKKLINNNQ